MYEVDSIFLEKAQRNAIVMRSVNGLRRYGVLSLVVLYDTQDYVQMEPLYRLLSARDVFLWLNLLYGLSY